MPVNLPTVPGIPLEGHELHLKRVVELATFEEVEAWDAEATRMVNEAGRYLEVLAWLGRQLDEAEQQARAAHAKRSVLARWFMPVPRLAAINQLRRQIDGNRTAARTIVEELQGTIDKTPDSRGERKAMVQDLRLVKKELGMKKRQINAAMRDVRSGASVRSANVGTGLGLFISTPSSRRFERMSIRLDKEAALAPHMNERDLIERQMEAVERHILWLEKIR
jgi:hypothetical protein